MSTKSFIINLPIITGDQDRRRLRKSFSFGCNLQNAVMGGGWDRVLQMRATPEWQATRAMPKGRERTKAFRDLRVRFRLSEYDFHADVAKHRKASGRGHLLGINEARATRKTGGTRSMEPILLQTSEADAGTRLDACLARAIEDLTRSAAAKAVEDGRVLVNGKAPNKSYKLTGHEQIEFTPEEPAPIDAVPQDIPLDVVYEDDDVIVVNKPSGLVVHPAPGHPDGTLVNALLYHCGDSLSGVGGALRPGIVHRIDRDTSGLIIAAKNDYAHQFLSAQLADHTLARTYECIVVGNLREDSGTVDAPIARDSRDRKRMAVVPGGRRAVTHWEVIARYPGYTHVRCRLETGRTHQIRVHMAYLGHPILGDTVYGAKKAVPGLTGQCLHAVGLQFIHPRTKELVSLTCPLPEEFTAMLRKIDR